MITDSELGAELGHALDDDSDVTVLPCVAAGRRLPTFDAITDALAGTTHVLYAPQATSDHFDAESGYGLFNAARKLTAAVTEMGVAPRLYLLTRNAQPVDEGDRANPAPRGAVGFGPHPGTGAP